MKRKIIAIYLILLLVAIPEGFAQASVTSQTNQNNETTLVEITTLTDEGTLTTETISLSESELTEIQNNLATLFEEFPSTGIFDNIKNIINNMIKGNHPLLSSISKIFLRSRLSHSRALVISQGFSYNFNPFRQNRFKIKKPFTFWFYSTGKLIKSKTLIFRPLALQFQTLNGRQLGIMVKFTGVYINIIRPYPEQSYTFFAGTAHRIMGLELFNFE